MTVNPTLPGTEQSIRRAASELGIAGVRILPGFHNYSLDTPEVDALCNLLRRLRLPLFLTLRMEDERQCYLLYPRVLPVEEIISFLNRQSGIPTLICNVRLWEITELREAMQNRGDVFADCSGFKDKPFLHEYLTEHDLLRFVVYGSLAPVFCMTSTVLLMKDCVARTRADEILSAENFLNSVARQENS
ncbi:MAG: hypothetical protein GX541_00105 [Clostridiales bacterium]|nr:hypothetical protein [Clostridiales bacterium]